jgi:hypothetical protein
MALTALNIAALPVIAGLMAGTGAMGAYVIGPTLTPASASAPVSTAVAAPQTKPCEQQTWPYIENRCVATGVQQNRKVRLVAAPRAGVSDVAVPEASTEASTPDAAPRLDAPAPAVAEKLVTRDTVGRSVETAPPAAMPRNSKRVEKHRLREERKLARQAYQVPSEANGRRDTRPVIVVRPLRLEAFR